MRVTLNNNKIEIIFAYQRELVEMVKSFDGRQYIPGRKTWVIPVAGAQSALDKLFRQRFTIEPAVFKAVEEDQRKSKEHEAMAVLDDTEFETTLPLFNYQRVGANFLYSIGSGLLGDQPGLGKSLMSIAVAERAGVEKVLIFTPSAVKWQFAGEIDKFLPGSKVIVITGTPEERRKLWQTEARFYVANYELLLRDMVHINVREWDLILADEATKISNPFAKQSKAIKILRAKRRIAMTGTPISNHAQDLFNILDFIDPGCFGNYYNFVDHYCIKNQWGGIFGNKNTDELKSKLKRYMIRRTREEVLPELPTRTDVEVPFELSKEEREMYDNIRKEILFQIRQEDISKLKNPVTIQATIVKLLRLQQLTNSMELLGDNKKSSKIEVLKELLEENVENGKVLVYTKFSQFADILERELKDYRPLKITGDVKDRQPIIEAFNTNDENRVMIITDAASHGLNLQFKCSTIVLTDLPFSLAKLEQIIGRVHRIGQKNKVVIYSLLGIKTVDYHLKKILEKKKLLSEDLLTMEDVQEILE